MPKAASQSTTRRALFSAAPAIAATAALPRVAMAAPGTAWDQWRHYRAEEARIKSGTGGLTDEEVERFLALEDRVLQAPIRSKDDANAVLCAVGLSIDRGLRTDGADQEAYQRAVAWLEAHA